MAPLALAFWALASSLPAARAYVLAEGRSELALATREWPNSSLLSDNGLICYQGGHSLMKKIHQVMLSGPQADLWSKGPYDGESMRYEMCESRGCRSVLHEHDACFPVAMVWTPVGDNGLSDNGDQWRQSLAEVLVGHAKSKGIPNEEVADTVSCSCPSQFRWTKSHGTMRGGLRTLETGYCEKLFKRYGLLEERVDGVRALMEEQHLSPDQDPWEHLPPGMREGYAPPSSIQEADIRPKP